MIYFQQVSCEEQLFHSFWFGSTWNWNWYYRFGTNFPLDRYWLVTNFAEGPDLSSPERDDDSNDENEDDDNDEDYWGNALQINNLYLSIGKKAWSLFMKVFIARSGFDSHPVELSPACPFFDY